VAIFDFTRRRHPTSLCLGQVSTTCESPPFPTDEKPAQVSDVFDGIIHSRLGDTLPDVVIRSADQVYFAVHCNKLVSQSTNEFGHLLAVNDNHTPNDLPMRLNLEEPGDVLNVVLHVVYGLSCSLYKPTLACIGNGLRAMRKYGVTPLERYTSNDSPLYHTVLLHAPNFPLETYALAAEFELEELAQAASAHTLHMSVHVTPVELALQMGAMYLHRLNHLHQTRTDQLKDLLIIESKSHEEKPYCSNQQQYEAWLEFKLTCIRMISVASCESCLFLFNRSLMVLHLSSALRR
jgi:hypothetical protein